MLYQPTADAPCHDLENPGKMNRTYRKDIDGLRAIAVRLVIAFHEEWTLVRGGFVGVAVLFVISDYLSVFGRDAVCHGRTGLSLHSAYRNREFRPLSRGGDLFFFKFLLCPA